jgi:hypothetical protein
MHNRLQSECHEGTGEWFFKTEEFGVWMQTKPSFLWIRGIRESLLQVVLCPALKSGICSWEWEERSLGSNDQLISFAAIRLTLKQLYSYNPTQG